VSAANLYGARVVLVKMNSPPRALVLRDDFTGRYYLVRPDGDRFAIEEITPREVVELVAWKADNRRQNISTADGRGGERK